MSFTTDLYDHLSTHAGLSALISTRIYPTQAPQKVIDPFCVYTKLRVGRVYSHQGFSNLSKYWLQISCFADTAHNSMALVDQLVLAMEAWPGVNSKIQSAFHDDDSSEQTLVDPNLDLYYTPVEFTIHYG